MAMSNKLGVWAFVVGLILAVVIAIVSSAKLPTWAVPVLAVLGILVGLLNITDKEVQSFLIAAVAFLLSFQSLSAVFAALEIGKAVGVFFSLVSVFMAPAAAIVAIIALFKLAKD